MDRWEGKVAVVTGASSGIGAAISTLLVKKGLKTFKRVQLYATPTSPPLFKVIGLARRVERIEELACNLASQSGQLFAIACDVTKEDDIVNAFKWVTDNVGPVHILINNAGLTRPTNLTDGSTELWRQVLDVNVLALCICTREAVRIMKENNIDGHVIHMNSIAGHLVSNVPNFNVYPASKFAVTALTETLRQELVREESRIKVTSISPGVVRTEFQDGFADDGTREILSEMPALTPNTVAEAVIYVLSTDPSVQVSELTIRSVGELF